MAPVPLPGPHSPLPAHRFLSSGVVVMEPVVGWGSCMNERRPVRMVPTLHLRASTSA